MTADEYVTDLYTYGFGRTPDAAGRDFWVNLINRGSVTWAEVDFLFANSPEMWSPANNVNIYTIASNISSLAFQPDQFLIH